MDNEPDYGVLARAIMDMTPRASGGAGTIPADQLALTLVLESGPYTIGQLRDALGLSQSMASNLVTRAENAGRVRRRQDPVDLRRSVVELTPKGKQERLKARWRHR